VADLRVDYSFLRGTSATLAAIAEEFEQLHERRTEDAEIWGAPGVRSAMGEFASNWDRHREDLTHSLQQLGTNCSAVADTFSAVDQALTRGPGSGPR